MNVEQKQRVLKVLNDFFNEADTSKMSVKRIVEISEAIDLVKNLHIPVVVKSLPSHKKGMLEINREIALFPKNSGIDIQSFGFGFNKGVRWCHKEITK